MADRTSQLVLSALSRAAAEPAGLPLHPARGAVGLFPASAMGRQAALRATVEGYLRPTAVLAPVPATSEPLSGRTAKVPAELYVLTDKGLSFLLSQTSPRPILEDLVRVLEARHAQASGLLNTARQMLSELSSLRLVAERVLERIREPGYVWAPDAVEDAEAPAADTIVLEALGRRQSGSGSGEDCPLPELFRRVAEAAPALTVGQFHDALRRLSDLGRVYLHPWTGPLYDLPEPAFALLVGHVVAYYASVRRSAEVKLQNAE